MNIRAVLTVAALSSMLIFSVGANAADAGSGIIHFKGSVIDAPCSITPDSIDQTIELGAVSKKSFKKVGDHSSPAKGEIKLVDCELGEGENAISKVSVTFSGVTDSDVTQLLNNESDASGVGVRLLDKEGQNIVLNTPVEHPLSKNSVISFQAYMEATKAEITVGDVTANATFKLAYK